MAEISASGSGNRYFYFLPAAVYRCVSDHAYSILGGHYLNLGWLAVPVLFFAVIGTVNGVNFTDGVDGLATSVT